MGNNKFNIKVNVKVTDQGPLKHRIIIRNVSKSHLKEKAERYILTLNVKSSRQKLDVVLSIKKDVIDMKRSMKSDITYIKFKEDNFDIEIERIYPIQMIKKQGEMYSICYKSTQFQLMAKVVNQLTVEYYESKFMPKIESIKKRKISERKNNRITPKKTSVVKQREKLSPEELRRKDFYDSDLYAYKYSPNSDGNRSSREKFGGSGSNMSRRGKRI